MPAKKTTPKAAAEKAVAAAPAKKAPAKKAAKTAAKKAAKPAAKTATKTATKKPAVKKPASYEVIAHAAYLNYRRRMDLGLPGDHDTDWLEAVNSVEPK